MLLVLFSRGYSQFGPQQIISEDAFGYPKITTADVDSDGDLDILLAGQYDISWYENTNGMGLFGGKQVVAENSDELALAVSAADLDGDGDLDVLSSFSYDWTGISKIAWNENLDGLGHFGPQQVIDDGTNVFSVFTIMGADLDNDGDTDVLIVDRNSDTIAWYKNLGGLGDFGNRITISTALDWPIDAVIADIDNDGNYDILSHGLEGDHIGWFENFDGLGSFGAVKIITTEVDGPLHIYAADIDMDGDLDVVSGSIHDNKIAWYENTDGEGTFGSQMVIMEETFSPRTLYVEDIDNDGDMDIITSLYENGMGEIFWLSNLDGQGNFSDPQLISNEVLYTTSVIAKDIDLDQDYDVVSASHFDQKIAWYENQTILNTSDFNYPKSDLFPNPFDTVVNVTSEWGIETVRVFNQLGELLISRDYVKEIDTRILQQGMYFFELVYSSGETQYFKMIKK
ncbi:MAG: hypothetical protein Aureis2KO_22250 [Aureisphaera sp.]